MKELMLSSASWVDDGTNRLPIGVGSRSPTSFARQAVLGPADPPPMADMASVRTIGTRRVGDVGALVWVAEQLDLVKRIDQACGLSAPAQEPTIGEMVLAVAVQRACAPSAKRHLTAFWSPARRAWLASPQQ